MHTWLRSVPNDSCEKCGTSAGSSAELAVDAWLKNPVGDLRTAPAAPLERARQFPLGLIERREQSSAKGEYCCFVNLYYMVRIIMYTRVVVACPAFSPASNFYHRPQQFANWDAPSDNDVQGCNGLRQQGMEAAEKRQRALRATAAGHSQQADGRGSHRAYRRATAQYTGQSVAALQAARLSEPLRPMQGAGHHASQKADSTNQLTSKSKVPVFGSYLQDL